jgi:hypothetical protein
MPNVFFAGQIPNQDRISVSIFETFPAPGNTSIYINYNDAYGLNEQTMTYTGLLYQIINGVWTFIPKTARGFITSKFKGATAAENLAQYIYNVTSFPLKFVPSSTAGYSEKDFIIVYDLDQALYDPINNLDRVFFDTRFNYLNIVREATFDLKYPFRDVNRQPSGKKGKSSSLVALQGTETYKVIDHGLGFTPAAILVDTATNRSIAGNVFAQNVDNTSFRIIYLTVDANSFYIKERYFVRQNQLPELPKTYKLYMFGAGTQLRL